jgi:hypothetical protein
MNETPMSERGEVTADEWGVAYELDENGRPTWPVELSDDEQDARAWAQASGDPDAKVMRRTVTYGAWTVA